MTFLPRCLLPAASLTPYSSEIAFPQDFSHAVDSLNRDGTRSQRLTTAFRPSIILAVKNFSQKTNYFPVSTIIEGQTVSVTESARPYRHNRRNEVDRQNGHWSGDIDTAFENPISNTSKMKYYRDSYKTSNTFNRRHSNTDDPLEDDDFAPIPIGEHQEQNNEQIEIFQFWTSMHTKAYCNRPDARFTNGLLWCRLRFGLHQTIHLENKWTDEQMVKGFPRHSRIIFMKGFHYPVPIG